MILVDTSVWVGHLRQGDARLMALLEDNRVACHIMVIGELALGRLRDRSATLALLRSLPQAPVAGHAELVSMIGARELYGRGVGLVDAHLLAATLLEPGMKLWTRDRRLEALAVTSGVAHLSS